MKTSTQHVLWEFTINPQFPVLTFPDGDLESGTYQVLDEDAKAFGHEVCIIIDENEQQFVGLRKDVLPYKKGDNGPRQKMLIHAVLNQIEYDLGNCDWEALEEMLIVLLGKENPCVFDILVSFLGEKEKDNFINGTTKLRWK